MHLRPTGVVVARARQAAAPAWHALIQVAVGADPAPAWHWRLRWQRWAAVWGLAAGTAAAFTVSVVYGILSAASNGNEPSPEGPQGPGLKKPPPPQPGELHLMHLQGAWVIALVLLVSLVAVAPLPLAARRPLLGWRLGWLALAGMPWLGIWRQDSGAIFAGWPWDPVQVAVLVVVFAAAGVRHPRGVLWWMWALTLLPWWLQAAGTRPGLAVLTAGTIVLTAVALAADAVGGRYRVRLELAGVAERAEVEAARRAVLEERARISRELHDVVAHHLSLIAVRAEAAPYRLDRLADDARAEFSELGVTSREALTEMRRLLKVLRTGETAEEAPQPGLGDLPGLVDAARSAGLPVQFSRRGPLDGLPVPVAVCAYRITQESLSNAGRHAPGAAINVTVDVEPPIVRLRICNGPPAARRNGSVVHTPESRGHGLAGMRERVTLLGGTFIAGPAPGGGFEVAAELPTGERG